MHNSSLVHFVEVAVCPSILEVIPSPSSRTVHHHGSHLDEKRKQRLSAYISNPSHTAVRRTPLPLRTHKPAGADIGRDVAGTARRRRFTRRASRRRDWTIPRFLRYDAESSAQTFAGQESRFRGSTPARAAIVAREHFFGDVLVRVSAVPGSL